MVIQKKKKKGPPIFLHTARNIISIHHESDRPLIVDFMSTLKHH